MGSLHDFPQVFDRDPRVDGRSSDVLMPEGGLLNVSDVGASLNEVRRASVCGRSMRSNATIDAFFTVAFHQTSHHGNVEAFAGEREEKRCFVLAFGAIEDGLRLSRNRERLRPERAPVRCNPFLFPLRMSKSRSFEIGIAEVEPLTFTQSYRRSVKKLEQLGFFCRGAFRCRAAT